MKKSIEPIHLDLKTHSLKNRTELSGLYPEPYTKTVDNHEPQTIPLKQMLLPVFGLVFPFAFLSSVFIYLLHQGVGHFGLGLAFSVVAILMVLAFVFIFSYIKLNELVYKTGISFNWIYVAALVPFIACSVIVYKTFAVESFYFYEMLDTLVIIEFVSVLCFIVMSKMVLRGILGTKTLK